MLQLYNWVQAEIKSFNRCLLSTWLYSTNETDYDICNQEVYGDK